MFLLVENCIRAFSELNITCLLRAICDEVKYSKVFIRTIALKLYGF